MWETTNATPRENHGAQIKILGPINLTILRQLSPSHGPHDPYKHQEQLLICPHICYCCSSLLQQRTADSLVLFSAPQPDCCKSPGNLTWMKKFAPHLWNRCQLIIMEDHSRQKSQKNVRIEVYNRSNRPNRYLMTTLCNIYRSKTWYINTKKQYKRYQKVSKM